MRAGHGGGICRPGRRQCALAAHRHRHRRDSDLPRAATNCQSHCRKPDILADAAHTLFEKPKSFSGHFLIDDNFLAENGVTDFDHYRVDPTQDLIQDFFVPDDMPPPKGVSLKAIRCSA